MIDTPPGCANPWNSVNTAAGPATIAAAAILPRIDGEAARITAKTAASTGPSQTGHESATPAPHAAASQR